MKKIVLWVLLLASATTTHPAMATAAKAVVKLLPTNINIEGNILQITSDVPTGQLSEIRIYRQSDMALQKRKFCSGYSCEISISDLAGATHYVARAYISGGGYEDHVFYKE